MTNIQNFKYTNNQVVPYVLFIWLFVILFICLAGVVELADTHGLEPCAYGVRVQVPPSANYLCCLCNYIGEVV